MLTLNLSDEEVLAGLSSEQDVGETAKAGHYTLDTPIMVKGHDPLDRLELREPTVFDILVQARVIGKRATEQSVYDSQIALVARIGAWPLKAVYELPSSLLDEAVGYVCQFEEDARRLPDAEPDRAPELHLHLEEPVQAVMREWSDMTLREPKVEMRRRFKATQATATQEAFLQAEITLVQSVGDWPTAAVLKMPISKFATAADYLTGFFITGQGTGNRFLAG